MEIELLTEETIIGSRSISKTEFRKFLNETLGENYEKYAVIMDVLKIASKYNGRTLKEIIEECYNPSWYDKMDESLTSYRVQKETKAKIDDVIPYYLDSDLQKSALDFAAYLYANKMNLKWNATNKWKVFYKGKVLCWVYLDLLVRPIAWIVSPCLTNINEYEDVVISEGLEDFVLDNFKRCKKSCRDRGVCKGTVDKSITILGKEVYGICREIFYVNNKKVDYVNPDETTINRIKKLLELERIARNDL